MSYSKHKTEFIVKIDSTEWNSERSLPVSQSAGQVGTEATFDVSYEPTSLGTKSTIMTISSPSGGDYTFPLIGKCLAPNPQGEFRTRDRRTETGESGPSDSVLVQDQLGLGPRKFQQSRTRRDPDQQNFENPGPVRTGRLPDQAVRGPLNFIFYDSYFMSQIAHLEHKSESYSGLTN